MELFKVVCALTPRGRQDANLVEQRGPYYQAVMQHFQPYAAHPIVRRVERRLGGPRGLWWYVASRTNGCGQYFAGPHLRAAPEGPPARLPFNSLRSQRRQWENFAAASQFRAFFAAQRSYYRQDSALAQRLLPLAAMQRWLEAQFPARYAHYRVVVSPLIGGTHSTRTYGPADSRTALMLVSSPRDYAALPDTALAAALYSGVVFTEIDHHYVNPISSQHARAVKQAFAQRTYWTAGRDARHYPSPLRTFNEYMTHAVYLLYVHDRYPPAVYEAVRRSRVRLNEERRGFVRFGAFADELLRLYHARRPGQTVAALYPDLLAWCRQQPPNPLP
ncbi:DUF4932 domain-containing protein [Hymenobacter latericus]|uniref:DUF4932 domain-containing protein n=1 Tax=Hymenobacter sp. YIM 151858-1 TaxID=2987688 RepID=UPI002227542F|nr:DUF4932 domain-containing protein [Hymenobacter sp. YIM 151858-1]UYZ58180.1 DUF4932 domain-containing protein [Hymenobacter sp. YIM 151858-1]